MKSSPKNVEQLNKIVSLIRQGITSPANLSKQLGLSVRQVYRYLELGVKQGVVYRPTRNVFFPTDVKAISFETFAISNSKNVNVRMSKKEQHNTTKQFDDNFNLVDFDQVKTQTDYKRKTKELISENVTNTASNMSLQEVITSVLDIAQMPYSVRDLRYAKSALYNSAWWLITKENVLEYTLETIRRMNERLDLDPLCIKTNAVGYLFGILRNVVSCDARVAKKKWVQLLAGYSQVAAGAEEVAVSISEDNNDCKSEILVSTTSLDFKQEKLKSRKVPAIWQKAQEILNSMIQKLSLYSPKRLESPVLDILDYLDKEEIPAQNVESALNDVAIHDEKAARYLISLIKSRSVKKVQEQLDKHFWRSVVRDSNDSPGVKSQPKDKYETFYGLFPD